MHMFKCISVLSILLAMLLNACSPSDKEAETLAPAPHSTEASPENYSVIAENEYLRVLIGEWKPGVKDKFHSHPPFGVYFLTDFDGRLHYPDGTTQNVIAKAGKAMVRGADPSHAFENLGNTLSKMILVERKTDMPVEALEGAAPHSTDISPEVYRIIAENEHLRIILASWEPGQRDIFHSHPPFIVYFLTDIDGHFYKPGDPTVNIRAKKGKAVAHFADPVHAVENLSYLTAKMLIVEAK